MAARHMALMMLMVAWTLNEFCLTGTTLNEGKLSGVPIISTACVLIGVTSECTHKEFSKAKCFIGQVPEVCNVKDIVCRQLEIVARMKHGCLLHKTPTDFAVLYVARIQNLDAELTSLLASDSSTAPLPHNVACSHLNYQEPYVNFHGTMNKRTMNGGIASQETERDGDEIGVWKTLVRTRCECDEVTRTSSDRGMLNQVIYGTSTAREEPSVVGVLLELCSAIGVNAVITKVFNLPGSILPATTIMLVLTMIFPRLRIVSIRERFCRLVFGYSYSTLAAHVCEIATLVQQPNFVVNKIATLTASCYALVNHILAYYAITQTDRTD